jgi:hypothetical protein
MTYQISISPRASNFFYEGRVSPSGSTQRLHSPHLTSSSSRLNRDMFTAALTPADDSSIDPTHYNVNLLDTWILREDGTKEIGEITFHDLDDPNTPGEKVAAKITFSEPNPQSPPSFRMGGFTLEYNDVPICVASCNALRTGLTTYCASVEMAKRARKHPQVFAAYSLIAPELFKGNNFFDHIAEIAFAQKPQDSSLLVLGDSADKQLSLDA